MVPAGFRWNDLGSWQSLLEVGPSDKNGNVIVGDVVAIDCENSYLRSHGRLLSAIGLKDMAIVSTPDATFVAPVSHSQNVRKIVEQLQKSGRLETKFTPADDRVLVSGAWRERVRHWLFEETLPLWSTVGVDERARRFLEAWASTLAPLLKPKRMRTMARQVYAFAVAKARGWDGPADRLIAHGLDFMAGNGRTDRGGWVRTLNVDGSVADPAEDAYDHSCVLLALAHAHLCGHPRALRLGEGNLCLSGRPSGGPAPDRLHGDLGRGRMSRRSNPHMHLLEAFLAWHSATGDRTYLRRAARIVDLFKSHFFDAESWTLGEISTTSGGPLPASRAAGPNRDTISSGPRCWPISPRRAGRSEVTAYARKLYASAIANGLNRATGWPTARCRGRDSPRQVSRSWPQAEAVKAAIALDGIGGPDLKPEVEARVGRLFRWHSSRPRSGCGSTASTIAAGRWRPTCRPASFITSSAR